MTVREYFTRYARGADKILLCDFGPEGNHLNIRKIGRRLDVVDDGCCDTGTNSSTRNVVEVVNEWLRCVEAEHLIVSSPDDLPQKWADPPASARI